MVHGFLLEAWAGGCAFLGVLLQVTQKQVLRLGKMLPMSPGGMERTATRHTAGSHLADGSASPRGSWTPDRSGHPGFDGCLTWFGSLSPREGITGTVPALSHASWCGDRRRSGLQCGWVLLMLGSPCSRQAPVPGVGQGVTAHLRGDM